MSLSVKSNGLAGRVLIQLGAAAALGAAEFLGLRLATLHGNVSAVWPATGVAIWMLSTFGRRTWPVVMAVSFLAELTHPSLTPLTAAALAAGSTLEALVGAWLWRWIATERPWESRDAMGCFVAALAAPVVSAGVGALTMVSTGAVAVSFQQLWITWWMGDAVGALTLLPVLMAAPELGRIGRGMKSRELGKALIVLAAAGTASWLAFKAEGAGAFLFTLFPVLLLAMIWFGAAGVRVVALLIAIAGIAAEFSGQSVFASGSATGNLLNLQLFLASVAVAALVLPRFRTRGNMLPAVAVLLVGWGLSGWIFTAVQRDVRRRRDEVLDERVAAAQAALRVRMESYVDGLIGAVSYFAAAKSVDRNDWRVYAENLQLAKRYPGINGLGVIYPVQPDGVEAWLARLKAEGAPPDLKVVPFPATTGPADDVKYLITYIEPREINRVSVGRNIATEPSRRLAAEQARDTGQPRMNRRIPGSRDAQRRPGFLLYLPLYRQGAPLGTVEERRAAHLGWVYAQFFVDNFLNGVLGPLGETLQLHFFEDGGLRPEHLLYASGAGIAPGAPIVLPKFDRVTTVEMADQRFALGWRRGPKYVDAEPGPMAWAAASFTFATLLLAGLVQSLQSTGQRARDLAEERTRELSATQRQLKGVLDGTEFSVIATTTEGIIEVFNAGAEHMLGYAAAEMVGRQTPALIHLSEEIAARAAELTVTLGRKIEAGFEALAAPVRTNQTDEREWTYVRKDGSRLPVWLSVTALRDGRGEIVGFLGIAQDITERKRQELRLRDTFRELERQKFALDEHADVSVTDVEGAIIYANDRFCANTGYARAELLGQNHRIIKSGQHPKEYFREMFAAITRGLVWHGEICNRSKDGRFFWARSTIVPFLNDRGEPTHYVAIRTDITEQREGENRLRQQHAALAELTRDRSRSPLGVAEVFRRLVEAGARALRVDRASIWLLSPDRTRLVCQVLFERAEDTFSSGAELAAADYPAYFAALEAGRFISPPCSTRRCGATDASRGSCASRAGGRGATGRRMKRRSRARSRISCRSSWRASAGAPSSTPCARASSGCPMCSGSWPKA
ncbi:MAG: CHASE domain-containing protein [Verrucomicrobia bacterium]|nr:CHASE domain-containing protein [Verrucomicrobiota bacterium]